ncbi:hypothetical protein [Acidisarcina polymorpha]|uniref:hypothetical protein n=1 Tax=Acidisarcina polymorpha TaxID=2211140 RepID=UPI000DF00801|nr:hypothetical protein [Acidisarcina polymorpha]
MRAQYTLIPLTAAFLLSFQITANAQQRSAASEQKAQAATQAADASGDPNTLDYTTSWIGNTYPGNGTEPNHALQHVPLDVDGIYATPDGKIYSNTTWDEGGRPVSIFKEGKLISPLNALNNSPNFQNGGGDAVAADERYIYKGNSANGTDGGQGISVLNASDLTGASVSLTGSSTLPKSYEVNGITIADGKIYVAEGDENVVDVFDQKTLGLIRSLSILAPARIAVDQQGGIWVSENDNTPLPNLDGIVFNYNTDYGLSTIRHFDCAGKLINTITLPEGGEVSALWIDNLGFLLVGDEGPDQNIKVYGNLLSAPFLVRTLGVKGGVYAGNKDQRGTIGPWRFRGITGIATDSLNNLYVSQNGWGYAHGNGHGTQLQSYNIFGETNWSVDGLEFVTTMDMDQHTQRDIYDPYHHFKVDFSRPAGQEATYVADTVDRFRYPDDVRITGISSTTQIQYIEGKKFLLVGPQSGGYMAIYRFDDSASGPGKEIAIPCAAFDYGAFQGKYQDFDVQPDNGEFIWRDLNGDGKLQLDEFLEPPNDLHRDGGTFWMDSNGDVWQVNYQAEYPPYENSIHLRRYLFQGFDSYGAPIYDFNHMVVYDAPNDFQGLTSVGSAIFDPQETDGGTLYVYGGTNQIARYDHWDKGNRTPKWILNVPFDPDPNNTWSPESFTQDRKYVFVDFNTPHYTLIYSTTDGSYVGRFTPGTDVGGLPNIGNDDEWQSIRAHHLKNGEYLLLKEEDYQAKQLLFKWTPPSTLTKISAPAPPTSVTAVPADEQVTLSWTGGAGALVYTVSRSTTKGGPYTAVDSGIYQTNVTDLGLTNGTTYYYVVSSLSETGTSINSPELEVTPVAYGKTYEAEDSVISGANIYPCPLCSGGALVGYLVPGTSMTFTVTVPATGAYAIRIYDCNGDSTTPPADTIGIKINDGAQGVSPVLPFTGTYSTPGYVTFNASLSQGKNAIVLGDPSTFTNGSPNIDRIVVPTAPSP